jgi:tetratricopeptide (TPR) repeat protein
MAIKLKPDYTDAYVERAFSYIFLNKSEESKLDFDKAIELNPYDARIYSSRGTCCGTVSDLDSAIRLDNEQPLYYEMRGNIRCERRDFFGGLIDYTQCVKLKATSLRDCFDSFVHYVYNDERDRKLHFHLNEG